MSDLLFLLGVFLLVLAASLLSMILGLAVAGAAFIFVALALSDGKGLPWRS